MINFFSKIKQYFCTIKYSISKKTAQTIANALTTLDQEDDLIIESPKQRIIIHCLSKKK